jgi:Na+/H+ antiporter NhaD/arsenite permease-like protein
MVREHDHESNGWAVPTAIAVIIILYVLALLLGWPQRGTQSIVAANAVHGGAAEAKALLDKSAVPGETIPAAEHANPPPIWMVIPFVVLLAAIAVLPLIPATEHWWDSNLHRFLIAIGLGIIVLAYYALLHRGPVQGHWPAHHIVQPVTGPLQLHFVMTVLANAMLQEFVPFIVLLFSLFTIAGGIRITGDLQAHPLTNATFLSAGAFLASFIGTTGAAMLLIRPLLDTNRQRKRVVHTVIFFIFIVCNCGGCLLPLGDPPLFLGYLQGVPFTWTLHLWREWLFVNGALIITYLLLDQFWHFPREHRNDAERDISQRHSLLIQGWKVNAPLLVGVVLAVALLDPSKPVPGTGWHPWLYLREIVQLALVAMSLVFGDDQARIANKFNYQAIVEVAALFSGIFITMQPALENLSAHGDELGLHTPAHFFWATGTLSSVLDNAPTYLVFFQAAQAIPQEAGAKLVAGVEEITLMGISLGAVFMGAMTYIGNGPNFMVRAIAEKSGVKMPSFFGYMVYSCVILLPVLAAMVWYCLLFPY